jgi:DNA-binding beta-propeller fold protein YncE
MNKIEGARNADDVWVGSGRFRYRVEPRWTTPADGNLGEVVGVACDADDRVYLFARGTPSVSFFERDGRAITCWADGLFTRPHGICVGPDGAVYCTDDFGHAVHVFTSDGRPRLTLGTSGKPSATGATSIDYRTIKQSAGPFNYPTNVAIAPSGDLFIADGYGNARIHHFSPDGRLLHSWGEPGSGPGQFHVPHGIAVDADGIVYVADRENSRIQRFNAHGAVIDAWTDVVRPCQVCIDRAGYVYVAELGLHAGRWPGWPDVQPGAVGGRVSIFDRNEVLQARWGGGANPCAAGDFFAPHDICVDSRGDIYVAEVTLSGGARAGKVPMSCHTLQKFVRQPLAA